MTDSDAGTETPGSGQGASERGNPIRIQRSRKPGWRKPPNTVCIDRSTNWGNPYRVHNGADRDERVNVVELFRFYIKGSDDPRAKRMRADLHTLRGKNLACYCPEGEPCHGDVLLKLANTPAPESTARVNTGAGTGIETAHP